MSNKILNVKGILNPSNSDSVKWGIGSRMEVELARNGLVEVFNGPTSWTNEEWKQGQVIADSHTDIPGGGRPAAMDFITRLYTFVTAPGIAELGLQGELLVTVGAVREPIVFKISVKDNNVFYQQADLTFAEPIPFMEKTEGTNHA